MEAVADRTFLISAAPLDGDPFVRLSAWADSMPAQLPMIVPVFSTTDLNDGDELANRMPS